MSSVTDLAAVFSEYITTSLKNLIESHHLYQSVSLPEDLLSRAVKDLGMSGVSPEVIGAVKAASEGKLDLYWEVVDPAQRRVPLVDVPDPPLSFEVPNVKIFCTSCDRIEAFNVLSAEDFLSRRGGGLGLIQERGKTVQAFVISFQCQSCKGPPEAFLIRRVGGKLTLCGRSPIEHVDVPKVIHKSLKTYYSGAIVAHQSGFTLAGNFMLRVLVEQWVRSCSHKPEGATVEDLLKEYSDLLPPDFKSRFPSLTEVYKNLSTDMHSAAGSKEVFDLNRKKIEEHFDALRLFRLMPHKETGP